MRTKAGYRKNPLIVIVWIIKTPIRALSKAKQFYIKGITNFSTSYNRPMMIIEEANRNNTMEIPMSFSTAVLYNNNSIDQQSRGLIRASSDGSITMADIERFMIQQKQNEQLQLSLSRKGVARSCSLGMGRIDEDRASSFRDDNIILFAKTVNGASRLSKNLSRAQ